MNDLMDLSDIANLLKLSKHYVRDKLVKRPDFPRPALSLSQKCRRWKINDIQNWITHSSEQIAR